MKRRSVRETERRREAPSRSHIREYGEERFGAGEYGADSRGKPEHIRDGAEARSADTGLLRRYGEKAYGGTEEVKQSGHET